MSSEWGESNWSSFHEEEQDQEEGLPSLSSGEELTKDSMIFLIDASEWMGEERMDGSEGSSSTLNVCLQTAVKALKSKIQTEPDSFVGIVFFNSKKARNENDFEHLYEFLPLQQSSARAIKEVEALLVRSHFEQTVGLGKANQVEYSKALWACSMCFASQNIKNSFKRVLLFTNNDEPVPQGTDLDTIKLQAKEKHRDLLELGIEVKLMPFHRSASQFDVRRFYWDVLGMSGLEMDEERIFSEYKELEQSMSKRTHKKRTLGHVDLELAPGVALGAQLFLNVKPTVKTPGGWLEKKTNEVLTTQTQYLCATTGQVLEPFQMKQFYKYGGEKVFFSKEEMKQIKDLGDPGMKLLGFKPQDRLKLYHAIKPAYFMYPDEESVKGSTVAFSALLKEMHALKKMAICKLIYRKSSTVNIVALLPQLEEVDEDGFQKRAPGFHVMFLPYADDVRKLEFPPQPIATPEQVKAAKEVVEALTLKGGYEDGMCDNPDLQKHYAYLQALALDEEDVPKFDETLKPDLEAMKGEEGKIERFGKAIFGEDWEMGEEAPQPAKEAPKRKGRDPLAKSPARKKQKQGGAAGDEAETESDDVAVVKKAFADGKTSRLKKDQLQAYLRSVGLPVSGNKGVLIDRIEQHLER